MKYVFLYRVNRNNMKLRKYYPTIVLSDIHLGSEHSRTEEVTNFLKHVNCGRLILNGDIIDGWQLRKSGRRWKQQHTDFFKVLMKMMEKQGTEIIYVRGNHDDFLDNLVPFTFSNLSIVKDYILNTHGKCYLVTHGISSIRLRRICAGWRCWEIWAILSCCG